MSFPTEVDVVIVGGGMGGLVAAVAAQEDGASVLCLEKGPEAGGSLALSGGYVWTVPTLEDYISIVPEGDLALGRALVEDLEDGIEWMREHGARFAPRGEGYGPEGVGVGYRIQPDTFAGAIEPLSSALAAAGGRLVVSAPVRDVSFGREGRVAGVRFVADGEAHDVRCSSVVIATGGFQGDRELIARYIGPWADMAYLRSNPYSTGDGFRFATAGGAGASKGLRSFYGHLMPAPPAALEPGAFRGLTQFYSKSCLLLNMRGHRFVDESRGDAMCALATAREPNATAFIVFDATRYANHVMEPYLHDAVRTDPLALLHSVGGVVVSSDTLEGLARELLDRYGVPAAPLLATVTEFTDAARLDRPDRLTVARRDDLHVCDTSPFYAVPVRPGLTFTEGGVAVNDECQALDPSGVVISGLFVAGADVGGISNEGYVGGLGAALVTGLRAGIFAARSAA